MASHSTQTPEAFPWPRQPCRSRSSGASLPSSPTGSGHTASPLPPPRLLLRPLHRLSSLPRRSSWRSASGLAPMPLSALCTNAPISVGSFSPILLKRASPAPSPEALSPFDYPPLIDFGWNGLSPVTCLIFYLFSCSISWLQDDRGVSCVICSLL